MNQEEKLQIQERIVDVLKTVYDPEIPVDIWNLGMIYKIEVNDDGTVDLDMTFTVPNSPAADFIVEGVRTKLESVEGVDINQFEHKVCQDMGLIPEIGPRYRTTYFNHIFSSGYSAGYYGYLWAEVLDKDAFSLFEQTATCGTSPWQQSSSRHSSRREVPRSR